MPDKLEQIMKKIHIYLANCKESAYSSEDLIVSKKRIFALLEELNYAVYDVMEQYEATTAARDRGQAAAERMAAEIKDDAVKRAEDVYAASLLYTQDAIADMKNALEYVFQKTKTEYDMLIGNYTDRMQFLEENSQEITSRLESMADAKTYLHIIEDIKKQYENRDEKLKEAKEQGPSSKSLGTAAGSVEAVPEESDGYESKLAVPIVVEVHETPKIPEGFGKGKGRKKGKKNVDMGAVQSQNLDAEYFAFQEEQERRLAEQLKEELGEQVETETAETGTDAAEPEEASSSGETTGTLLDTLKKFSRSGKKK